MTNQPERDLYPYWGFKKFNGVRTNGGRLAVNQVTCMSRWFDSARTDQFTGEWARVTKAASIHGR